MRLHPLVAYLALSSFAIAAPSPKATLLELAKKQFAPRKLTEAEVELFTGTEKGENASATVQDKIVHADCIVWLCTKPEAVAHVTYRGVDISGMTIQGDVDLSNAQIPFPLRAENCKFEGEISLITSHIRSLDLRNCELRALAAEGAQITGSVLLQPGFKADSVKFLSARIDGSLECDGAQINNPQGVALDADGAEIKGRVFLREGFNAQGEVRFLSATIGGNLECDGAHLNNPQGKALNCDGAKIGGSIFLRTNFEARGEVTVLNAIVGGALDCSNEADFINPQGKALALEAARVNGPIFLTNGFRAFGEVSFQDAT